LGEKGDKRIESKYVLSIPVTWRVSNKRQELLTFYEQLGSPPVFGELHVGHLFSFLWIVHSWYLLQFSLDCPFLMSTSVFFRLSILDVYFSFLWIVHSWCLLQFSLDCPFLISTSVFFGLSILDVYFSFLLRLFSIYSTIVLY
jgi:hypothetical protein